MNSEITETFSESLSGFKTFWKFEAKESILQETRPLNTSDLRLKKLCSVIIPFLSFPEVSQASVKWCLQDIELAFMKRNGY